MATAAPSAPMALRVALGLVAAATAVPLVLFLAPSRRAKTAPASAASSFSPREMVETSAFGLISHTVPTWSPDAPLAEVARIWKGAGYAGARDADKRLASTSLTTAERVSLHILKMECLLYEGDAARAYEVASKARALVEKDAAAAKRSLYTLVYLQGVAALRMGENENCVDCRGASACIIPFDPAAVHQKPRGARLATEHFGEYLKTFPSDLEVRWLLNLAHMTLGEYPAKVPPGQLISLDGMTKPEAEIGKFRDIAPVVGLDRKNLSGGAVMDDFDNDGLLDVVTTSFDTAQSMAIFRNTGDGRFKEITAPAGLTGELGGLNCVQGDYNNDGRLDLYVIRGAWLKTPIQHSLLRNNPDGTFTNVTRQAGLTAPANSNAAQWADYDNDGALDLFVCNESGDNRLYHNRGNGTFEERAAAAGVISPVDTFCKGVAWIDYNNDDYPDLFVNYLEGMGRLFRNDCNGRFTDVSEAAGIDGPNKGFSCWAFDYDNDGRQDLFATCYDRALGAVVSGIIGQPHTLQTNRLLRNVDGARFENVTKAAGLDAVFSTMGSNYADFDNDGFLDFYLATGDPMIDTLVPNRMFRNMGGQRFAEITGSASVGHLQKGHGVACGDWDRDGNVDLFVEMGGAVPGDSYHNVLFQNPGHDSRWITLKLEGRKTNRSAIGARIKLVTAGKTPQTIYRWVSSGSSFGGNPLQQTIGLGKAERIATLEVHWPTSRTTQLFKDLAVDQAMSIVEFAAKPRKLEWKRIPTPSVLSASR